jgi:hypothetical protein
MKRITALVLCVLMLFSSVSVFAEESGAFEKEIVRIVENYIDRYYTFDDMILLTELNNLMGNSSKISI